MSALPKRYLTPGEYLEIERNAEYKSEYHDGEMFAMAGASESHNLIQLNFSGELRQQFRGKSCRAYPSEMRVRIAGVRYVYPDASAICGDPEFAEDQRDTLLNPSVVIEVLSPSTESYDRDRKFELYKKIGSLREYVLIASDRIHVDLYVRTADGEWIPTSYDEPDETVKLASVGAEVRLADIYEKVEFQTV